MKYKKLAYDPTWLVELAKEQEPDLKWLHQKLSQCNERLLVSSDPAMIYFINPDNPNMPGSAWQHKECIELEAKEGSLVIDILENGNVGAVEFLWLIEE